MKQKYKDFLEHVSKDKTLQDKIKAIDTTDETTMKQDILRIANEQGYDLSMEDLPIPTSNVTSELSDDEMNAIAGGGEGEQGHVGCACPVVGGGEGHDYNDEKKYRCACVGYGQGGDGRAEDFNCGCLLSGAGTDDCTCFMGG